MQPQIKSKPQPFDPDFNHAIMQITAQLVPEYTVSDSAPATYQALKAHLEAGKMMVVADEGSGNTIFGNPAVNHAFRAWHDWSHWRGGFDFSPQGETATCQMQIEHVYQFFGNNQKTRAWASLLTAEIIGQRQYFERHRTYICDQRAFVRAYLTNPDSALAQRW